jgi:predicted DCC family thiol-disulfide oxidoreductase YuxK
MPNPVVVYDGDCGICEASSRWILKNIQGLDVMSHHQYGLSSIGSVWLVTDVRRFEGARAVSEILKYSDTGLFKTLGRFIGLPGIHLVAVGVYWLVARNRRTISRMLGLNACAIPQK